MHSNIQFILFFCLIYFITQTTCEIDFHNPHVQKKLQQKLKQETHLKQKSVKPSMCDNINAWEPREDRELFIVSNQNTLTSIKPVSPNLDNCSDRVDMIEIIWRYLFFESMHCIRVELDLGESFRKFLNKTNYKFYSFSYRELGKKNHYLSRQVLNESVNILTIRHANLRPYVICVNFYKNENIYSPFTDNMTMTSSNETSNVTSEPAPELSCPEYYTLLQEDDYTHNIDLCVDIDTQAHFLSDFSHQGHSNSELIMVVFITGLIIALLALITIANYIIQKPKKRLIMHNLRKMMQRRHHHHHHHHLHNENTNDEYTALTRSSSFGTKMSSSKPQIIITDFSSTNSLDQPQHLFLNYHSHHQKSSNSIEESKESDSLLIKATEKPVIQEKTVLQSILKPASSDDHSNPNIHSVTFHVGETIIEENEDSEESKLKRTEDEIEKPSVASMSHILDDKPWLFGRSQSLVAGSVTNGANGSRSNFEHDISQLNKRITSASSTNTINSHHADASTASTITVVNEANKAK